MNRKPVSNALGNQKVFRPISYTLLFLMLVCVLMIVGNLIQNTAAGWHAGVFTGIMLFIVMDRLLTYQSMKSLPPLTPEWIISVGTQWIVIILMIRFLLSYANGLDSFRGDLSLLTRGYFVSLLTPEFMFTVMLALIVWSLPTPFLQLLDEIGLDTDWALREESAHGVLRSDAVPAHQRLVNLIFSTGIVLVILAALARLNLRNVLSGLVLEQNRFSGAEAGALLYFVFGLALLSLSRLMSLQTHWNRLRIPISSKNLTRQWAIYSLFFLLMLAVVVSLLPAGDSLGLFPVVGALFTFLFEVFLFLAEVIVVLILLLFSLPFMLLGKAPPFMNRSAPPSFPTLPPVGPEIPMTSSAVWSLIRSILLWGSLIALILFAFVQFVRQHEEILAALRKSRVATWLRIAWQWLSRNAHQARVGLSHAIAAGWRNIVSRLEGTRMLSRPAIISIRSLDPRRRVYFFYLAMIRRAAEQGLARKPSQTPSEYAVTLENRLPAAKEDIDSITEAFMEARYSRQAVDAQKVNLVKATWERIRRALQEKSRSEKVH